jgi:hypothetical protein
MKKFSIIATVMFVLLVAGFATTTLADNTTVGIHNTTTATGTGGTSSSDQTQSSSNVQDQSMENSGNMTVNSEDKREHIVAPLLGAFVAAPTALVGNWIPLFCNPLFKSFSAERIHQMSASDSFFGGVSIGKVVHVSFDGKVDDQPIDLINWDVRLGAYSTDVILGEFECRGEFGMPMGASLGRCLEEAKKNTNTIRVFAAYRVRHDKKNTGLSIGSGAAGSVLGGGATDNFAGAISLGGLIGTTTASTVEAYDWTVIALNDGQLGTNDSCGGAVSVSVTVNPEPAPAVIMTVVPEPQSCDPESIWEDVRKFWAKCELCKYFCFNNQTLRYKLGRLYINLAVCTKNNEYLKVAAEHFRIAVSNYEQGTDTKSGKYHSEAKEIYKDSNYLLAGCYYVLGDAREKEVVKKHHLERYPKAFAE